MNKRERLKIVDVGWKDCEPYLKYVKLNKYILMRKFYPLFVDREDEIEQELLIVLVKIIRHFKAGYLKDDSKLPSYLISAMHNRVYRIARNELQKEIKTIYVEDILNRAEGDGAENLSWEDLIKENYVDFSAIEQALTKEELRMFKVIVGGKGSEGLIKLRSYHGVSWEAFNKMKEYVMEKVKGIIELQGEDK